MIQIIVGHLRAKVMHGHLFVMYEIEAIAQMMVSQTYEGGLGGEPGNEAHGGYTFCGLAALMLVKQAHNLDLPALLHFVVRCQVSCAPGLALCKFLQNLHPLSCCMRHSRSNPCGVVVVNTVLRLANED